MHVHSLTTTCFQGLILHTINQMQPLKLVVLPWTTTRIQYQYPYFTLFDNDSVEVWQVPSQGISPQLVTRLAHAVPYPGLADPSISQTLQPIVDSKHKLVVVPEESHDGLPPFLRVFSLETGELLQTVELSGQLVQIPLSYQDGKVLALVGDDASEPPYTRMTILICDVVHGGSHIGGVRIPARLDERERKGPNTDSILWPAFITPDFDLVATSSQAWEDTMEVLRYRTSQGISYPEPDRSFQLTETIDDGDNICPTYALPTGERSFALAVYEGSAALPQGNGCQSKVHVIDSDTMTVSSSAQPILGRISTLHFLSSQNAIIAVVKHNTGEEWGDGSPMATYIVAIDALTGARRRMDTIYHGVQGSAVVNCAITQGLGLQEPSLVVVYQDGSLSVVNAESFLSEGLPRDGERVQAEKPFPGDVFIEFAYVVESSVVMSVRGADGDSVSNIVLVHW